MIPIIHLAAILLVALPLAARAAAPSPAATTDAAPPATAAAPPATSTCGDHLLAADEDCDTCPADCSPAPCKPAGRRTATIALTPQAGHDTIGAASLRLAYRTDRLTLPTTGNTTELQARLTARQAGTQVFVNDLDHAVRIGVTRPAGLQPGPALTVTFDTCAGAPAPTAADLACRIDSCATGGVPTPQCTCTVTLD